MDKVTEILAAVRDATGVAFTEVGTGGGCMALEARLESGHWIVATDEGLCGFAERIRFESDGEHGAFGWFIGIYPNGTDHGCDWWGGTESVIDVCDYDAIAYDLPAMVTRALKAMFA